MVARELTDREMDIDSLLAERTLAPREWSPLQEFDLSSESDVDEVREALNSGKIKAVVDQVDLIANDLFELRHPNQKDNTQARAEFVQGILNQSAAFGKWFYFPWSGELVRYPDKEDHRALRTSRNRNLITAEEQQQLYDATIAVFGLSVGSNVVEKLVASGIGGKLVIGDPDHIEPSNLNRINGTFPDVGIKKIDLMAQKISQIDPYIEQVHLPEGATDENLEYLAENHRPDILVDEVDDLRMKAIIRLFAQREGIPVLMATDLGDKSLIDVERYDQHDAKPFGGRLKAADMSTLLDGQVPKEDKTKFMMKIVGLRHITPRLIESAMQVDKTIAGLPQLGVTASMGGALTAIAAREILLGRKLSSNRYVFSPKQTLELKSPTGLQMGLRTLLEFARSRRRR